MCVKRTYVVCVALVLSLSLMNSAFAVADANLVAGWALDEGSGTIIADTTATYHGRFVTDLDSDPNAEFPAWVPGYEGSAIDLDKRALIEIPDVDLTLTEVTITGWVKSEEPQNSWSAILMYRGSSGVHGFNILDDQQLAYHWNDSQWWYRPGIHVSVGEWTFAAMTLEPNQAAFYVNGSDIKAVDTPDTPFGPGKISGSIYLGGDGARTDNRRLNGALDDIRLYDRALTDEEIDAVMQSSPDHCLYAFGLSPADGSVINNTTVTLSWGPGFTATSSDVYIGTDMNSLTLETNTEALELTLDVEAGTTYYWRVDAVVADDPNSPYVGDVKSFSTPPYEAYGHVPADGAQYIIDGQQLSWQPGMQATNHMVIFGDDKETVENAPFGAAVTETSFDPGTLEIGKTYYWRVDEITDAPMITKGQVVSFSTIPDIEPAPDATLAGWWKMDVESEANAQVAVDYSGNGLHAIFEGDPTWTMRGDSPALECDGSGDCAVTPVPNINSNTVTMTAWVNVDNPNPWSGIIFSRGSGMTAGMNLRDGNELGYHWAGGQWGFSSGLTVPNNEWAFVALVIEPEQATVVINEQSSVNTTTHNAVPYDSGIIIGGELYGSRKLRGIIDDLRFYTRALSMDDLAAIQAE